MGIKFIVSLVLMYLYVYLKTKKSFHMLQQNWYNDGNRYVKWIIKNKKQEFFNIDILILLLLVFKLSNIKLETVMITFVIFYVLEAIFYLNRSKKEQEKLKLKFTSRVKRLLFTTFILYLIPTVIMYFNFNETNLIQSELASLHHKGLDLSTCQIQGAMFDLASLKGLIINDFQAVDLIGILGVKVK